jgi:phospholipid transport system substrate-binding protein
MSSTTPTGRLSRRFLLAACGLLAMSPGLVGAAAADEPRRFIAELSDRALAILSGTEAGAPARTQALAALLDEAVDLRLLARLVLGRHWQRASEEQRRDYIELFRTYALQNLTASLAAYTGRERLTVSGSRPAGEGDSLVGTDITVDPGRPPVHIDWRVRQMGGRPVIVDVVAEGVSLLVTNRAEFDSIVSRSGIDGLLHEMRGWYEEGPNAAAIPSNGA